MKEDITVVLNCFKRPHALNLQFEAITNQTVSPKNILIWQNQGNLEPFTPLNQEIALQCSTSVSNSNFGVWARFAYALNARTRYVCVFDDDTIPGKKWLENCLNTINVKNGLLGTIGVIFKDLDYRNYERFGWDNPNEDTKQVDIVGHSWFFEREWLGSFWRDCEIPPHHLSGEDVHFSYAIQKFLNLNTYVPPHPVSDKEMWGSQKELAYGLGVDEVAISRSYHASHFGQNLKYYKNKGFKFINNL